MASGLVNAKLLPPLMLSGVVVLLYGVVGGRVDVPRFRLSSEPMFVKDGKPVTISCTDTRGNNITTARWYRDNVKIFQTSYLHPNQALDVNRTASVYGRVAVNATIRHHDVILLFNSTLDDRSVWWCKNGNESSYKMTLCFQHIDECIRPNLTKEPQKAADDNNITLSCRHGGGLNVTTVLWYRNYVYIFQTSTGFPEALQDKQSDREDYKAVEERISVKANSTVHNVILRMNSALDAESVWTCENNQKFSSDLVIDTNQTGESTPLPLQSTTTEENAIHVTEDISLAELNKIVQDTSRKTTTLLKTTMATTEEYDTSRKTTTPLKTTMATTEEYELRKTAELSTSSTTYIIAGVVVAILLLIVVAIVIVLVAKRKASESTLQTPSIGTVLQAEDNVVVGYTGSASVSDPRESGLRINPVYIPTKLYGGLESGGDNLHPEPRGEYMSLDRNAVQPSNIYEHLTTYEQIANL